MQEYTIAVVDDDPHIRELVEAYLRKENYRTIGLGSGEAALELLEGDPPHMWVLDLMLPGMDGYELCRRIRDTAEVPIIMISAKDNEVDKILGLELGSDDYLVKPFSPRELVARVKRQLQRLRRLQGMEEAPASAVRIDAGPLLLLPEERRVFWHREEVDLTSKEYALLQLFAERPNRAYTREELLVQVWGDDYFGSDRAVDHLLKRLRKKIAGLPVEAVWGHGYRLRAEEGGARHEAAPSN
ncbi:MULTISPECIES: response regulator transcription factor [unclassified Paenibacillus]|uniref:response regulator transcription factor n=1 Tax=unclassified Paenibacillus TaxID=185978 RepID=UPI000953B83F|nr:MULTISPECIES: response regulator transcription factor [unclassified Paenibacillus]SIQ01739.1 two-component system, OmpR family, response regulator CssR [Paenibacillus sp. RU4X]SIQ21028.1 two-component system, OmpR family, response regulator CssR [Paenibacillus sp. RU4T]